MTPLQKHLLLGLQDKGGVRNQYLQIVSVATKEKFSTHTGLSCFCKGWLVSDGELITVTPAGLVALDTSKS